MIDLLKSFISGGLFKAGSKILDWIPGRDESIRNNIDKTKREMDEILKKKLTLRTAEHYATLAAKLRALEEKAKNR